MTPSAWDFQNAAKNRARCPVRCAWCSPVVQMKARLRTRRFSPLIARTFSGGVACDHVIFPGLTKAQIAAFFRRVLTR